MAGQFAASEEPRLSAREKAHHAPLLLVAVACLEPRAPNTPPLERMVSMGAAIQNMLLDAHAMGFGAGLTSGQAMASKRLYERCGLAEGEAAVCCVNIGTVSKRKNAARVRPLLAALFYWAFDRHRRRKPAMAPSGATSRLSAPARPPKRTVRRAGSDNS